MIAQGRKYSVNDAQILRRQFYDEHFLIRDYQGPEGDHPFSLVMMSKKEDFITGGHFTTFAKRYSDYKVKEFFGLSLTEFLDLPPCRSDELISLCMEAIKESNRGIDDASRKLEEARRLAALATGTKS